MSAPHELALRLAVLRVVADMVKDSRTAAATAARGTLDTGERLSARLPGGERIASVTISKGRAEPKVTDEDAFTAWVADTYPTEVEQITVVRESFRRRLLDHAKQAGAPVTATGEAIPGVEIVQGDPYPSVRLAEGARAIVGRAWRAGELAEFFASGLLAIEEAASE